MKTTARGRAAVALAAAALTAALAGVFATPAVAGTLPPTDRITPAAGCIRLTPGMNGVKVGMVQQRLGMGANAWETMDAATVDRVRGFQRSRGISPNGVVGPDTWRAMGFAEDFCFDRFQTAPQLPLSATPEQRTETFVHAALAYLGDEYVWGGAGPRGYGVDCSGLVLQALYAAGLDPQPISVDLHVQPTYRTSVALFEHSGLSHRPLSQVQRGDLVFYTKNSTGVINHVAIALGNGQLLEAKSEAGAVRVVPLHRTLSSQTIVGQVVRPFATPIEDKHAALGGGGGFLGGRTSGEHTLRGGRFATYQHGSIYWSPAVGRAHAVRGAIRDQWGVTGWESGPLGYPTTDELPTPVRPGRYSHFQRGSIYWTPSTGAHEVYGAIRERWASLGWENSRLGFPTSGEHDAPGGRRSDFQGGVITWDRATSATTVTDTY